jgi:hypothetical protein
MKTDVRSVAERLDEVAQAGTLDVSAPHERIKAGMRKLAERLYAAFPVKPEPAAAKYNRFAGPAGAATPAMIGEIHAYSGPQLDWVIDSYIASPDKGFCNHHLTIWLPDRVQVPHLAFAMGTIPQLFFFTDFVPRSDLWTNQTELDTYHARFNDRALSLAADPRFSPFVSREIYTRGALSPVGVVVQTEPKAEHIDFFFELAHGAMSQWIEWVKNAPPTPEAARATQGARDRLVRETICRRDPANIVAERVLGKAVTDELIALLDGTGRNR